MIGQQLVADIVEIADQRHEHAARWAQLVADMRHGGCALVAIDGDADDLGAGAPQLRHLAHGRLDIGGVGIGHRLDDDRGAAAHHHATDIDADRLPAEEKCSLRPPWRYRAAEQINPLRVMAQCYDHVTCPGLEAAPAADHVIGTMIKFSLLARFVTFRKELATLWRAFMAPRTPVHRRR